MFCRNLQRLWASVQRGAQHSHRRQKRTLSTHGTRKENSVIFRFLILVAFFAAALGMASAQNAGSMVMDMKNIKNSQGLTSHATQAYVSAMKTMQDEMKAFVPTNDPDKDFVIMMKPHHKAAIDMAR